MRTGMHAAGVPDDPWHVRWRNQLGALHMRTMICKHRIDTVCAIATELAGRDVVPWENVCQTCTACEVPQAVNYVTASIAAHAWRRDAGDNETAARLHAQFHAQGLFAIGRPAQEPIEIGEGPGTVLHDLLAAKGYEITPTCSCLGMIRQMNEHAIADGNADWSRRNKRLIADVMVAEYHRWRGRFILDTVLRTYSTRLILRACREWEGR